MKTREEEYQSYREQSIAIRKTAKTKESQKLYLEALEKNVNAIDIRRKIEESALTPADHLFIGNCINNGGIQLGLLNEAAIAALDKIPRVEITDDDRREYSRLYINLNDTYIHIVKKDAAVVALKLAIAWNEKIKDSTPTDKRELALLTFELAKLLGDTPETIKACNMALRDQPPVDYRNDEYFKELAEWKHRVGDHYAPMPKDEVVIIKEELHKAQHDIGILIEQNRQIITLLDEVKETMKKHKAHVLTGNVNTMFQGSNSGANSEVNSNDELSSDSDYEPESKRQTSPSL